MGGSTMIRIFSKDEWVIVYAGDRYSEPFLAKIAENVYPGQDDVLVYLLVFATTRLSIKHLHKVPKSLRILIENAHEGRNGDQ
jgi:hypothetical protein